MLTPIMTHLSPDEAAMLRSLAAEDARSVSSLVRAILRRALADAQSQEHRA